MYKIVKSTFYNIETISVIRNNGNQQYTSFLADPANTDYQQFKVQVLAGSELQDADGNVMTQEEATAFIKELP